MLNEEWDGSSWTEVGDLNTPRSATNGAGTVTQALVFTGYSPPVSGTIDSNEVWNGTSWTEINDLSTARDATASAGSDVSTFAAGNETGGVQSATEEFTASAAVSTVTTS